MLLKAAVIFDKTFHKSFAEFKSRQKGDYTIKECECK